MKTILSYLLLSLILFSCKKDILLEEKGLEGRWEFNQVIEISNGNESFNQPSPFDNVSIDIAEDLYAIWTENGVKHKGEVWEETVEYTVLVDYEECWEEVEEIWIDDSTYYEESYTVCEWRTREETHYDYFINFDFDSIQQIRAWDYEINRNHEITCKFTFGGKEYKTVLGREIVFANRRNP